MTIQLGQLTKECLERAAPQKFKFKHRGMITLKVSVYHIFFISIPGVLFLQPSKLEGVPYEKGVLFEDRTIWRSLRQLICHYVTVLNYYTTLKMEKDKVQEIVTNTVTVVAVGVFMNSSLF